VRFPAPEQLLRRFGLKWFWGGGDADLTGTDQREGAAMTVSADLSKILNKAYEGSSLAELLTAPVSALAGVSDGDAELLAKAFNIKTVQDLGKNKYFHAAAALTALGEAGGK
jgi:hypothetical protein